MSKKNLKASNHSIDETRKFHERYLRAINNPLRRKILRTLKEGYTTIEDLESRTGLDKENLIWHLAVLENASCVEKDSRQGTPVYKLTQEGRVVDYME